MPQETRVAGSVGDPIGCARVLLADDHRLRVEARRKLLECCFEVVDVVDIVKDGCVRLTC